VARLKTTVLIFAVLPVFQLYAQSFRTTVSGGLEVSHNQAAGAPVPVGINGSVIINLGRDTRFLRGVEIEITAPQAWLRYYGSLLVEFYSDLKQTPVVGVDDIEGRRAGLEPLPAKLQIVYQIPVRTQHSLRTTPYVTVPTGIVYPASFPVLLRIEPAVKGMSADLENMVFHVSARPIVSDEGAVRLVPHFPSQLRGRPFTVLIDDVVIENISEELLLREGEHHMVVLSDDYRNVSRRFIVERTRTLDLTIDLQDPTPLLIFEGPQNAIVFLDNVRVSQSRVAVEAGLHEIRFQIGDYTVIKTMNVQRGVTYRVALAVDLVIEEAD
jgi:hypothetical protein